MPDETQAQPYLNRKETSRYLRVSVGTIDSWTRQGLLPAAKLGPGIRARVVYRRVDLDAFVEKHLAVEEPDTAA